MHVELSNLIHISTASTTTLADSKGKRTRTGDGGDHGEPLVSATTQSSQRERGHGNTSTTNGRRAALVLQLMAASSTSSIGMHGGWLEELALQTDALLVVEVQLRLQLLVALLDSLQMVQGLVLFQSQAPDLIPKL